MRSGVEVKYFGVDEKDIETLKFIAEGIIKKQRIKTLLNI